MCRRSCELVEVQGTIFGVEAVPVGAQSGLEHHRWLTSQTDKHQCHHQINHCHLIHWDARERSLVFESNRNCRGTKCKHKVILSYFSYYFSFCFCRSFHSFKKLWCSFQLSTMHLKIFKYKYRYFELFQFKISCYFHFFNTKRINFF